MINARETPLILWILDRGCHFFHGEINFDMSLIRSKLVVSQTSISAWIHLTCWINLQLALNIRLVQFPLRNLVKKQAPVSNWNFWLLQTWRFLWFIISILSFVQTIRGIGFPLAKQIRVILCPRKYSWSKCEVLSIWAACRAISG